MKGVKKYTKTILMVFPRKIPVQSKSATLDMKMLHLHNSGSNYCTMKVLEVYENGINGFFERIFFRAN